MSSFLGPELAKLLQAVQFSARAHRDQLRKDGRTPYASHPFRVCLIVRQMFGIDDPRVLAAALLHDTIEDTTTDYDDIAEQFGDDVARWVGDLSKDGRLPYEEREEAYRRRLAASPWQVKVCKLADMLDNLLDSAHLSSDARQRTLEKLRGYLESIEAHLPPEAAQAAAVFSAEFERLSAPG